MSFDQHDTIGFQAALLSRLISVRLRDALAPLGISPAQAAALIEIGAADGLTQKQLVERLDVEQPGVARTLNGLEAEGWITREQQVGRAQGLHLTDRARAILPQTAQVCAEVNRQVLADMSRTEREHLIDRISEAISALRSG